VTPEAEVGNPNDADVQARPSLRHPTGLLSHEGGYIERAPGGASVARGPLVSDDERSLKKYHFSHVLYLICESKQIYIARRT